MATQKKTRWGILGTGRIAADFTAMLGFVNEAQIVAVGSRNADTAKSFAERFNIPKHYASYEDLCRDSEIDMIYVSTLHPLHYENAKMALHNGKGVLCEKALTINARQAKELIEYARSHKLFFMEAMWTRYFPIVIKLRQLINEGKIGDVKLFTGSFGFLNSSTARLHEKELGGGTLLDIGVYLVTFSQMVYKQQFPSRIVADGSLSDTGVDEQVTILLRYGEQQSSVLSLSFLGHTENRVVIVGTKGRIIVPTPFHCPVKFIVETFESDSKSACTREEFDFPLPEEGKDLQFNFTNGRGMLHEARYVHKLLAEGKTESDLETLDESLDVMKILDEIRRQIGVVYDADK